MNRSILALIIFLYLPIQLNAQVFKLSEKFKNHLEMNNLYGKVKMVKEYRYKVGNSKDSNNPKKEIDMYFITYYNEYGNITKVIQYRKDNSACHQNEYTYDSKNRIISDLDSSPDIPNSGMKTTYIYNQAGVRTEEQTVSLRNQLILSVKTFSYNNKGQLTGMDMHYNYDNHTDQSHYTYDKNNNIIEISQKTTGGTNLTKIAYAPNTKLASERIIYSFEGVPYFLDFTYDKYKNVISYKRHEGKEKTLDGSELRNYSFDEFNNWISCKNSFANKDDAGYSSASLYEREITYY